MNQLRPDPADRRHPPEARPARHQRRASCHARDAPRTVPGT